MDRTIDRGLVRLSRAPVQHTEALLGCSRAKQLVFCRGSQVLHGQRLCQFEYIVLDIEYVCGSASLLLHPTDFNMTSRIFVTQTR